MKEPEMQQIGEFMARILDNIKDESVADAVRGETAELCDRFPLYAEYRRA
jgi:glycine/serine hydroxymethyltransferase